MFEELKRITELIGPTGQEEEVTGYLLEEWSRYSHQVERTAIGNVVAHVGGQGKKLLIEAHADEIGTVVKDISSDGYLWVTTIQKYSQKLNPRFMGVLIGKPVVVLGEGGKVDGIYAAPPGHLATLKRTGFSWDDIFVDIGASNEKEVLERGINIGSRVVFNVPTKRMGKYIYGKAMDDRGCLAIMTELVRQIDPKRLGYDLYLGASVLEETGLVGGAQLAFYTAFDLAIALEVGMAGDIPLVSENHMPAKLGRGPMLIYKDGGAHYDRGITHDLVSVAEKNGIPLRGDGVALIKHGVPTAQLVFPTRYTHSPTEMVHEDDMIHCVELLKCYLEG